MVASSRDLTWADASERAAVCRGGSHRVHGLLRGVIMQLWSSLDDTSHKAAGRCFGKCQQQLLLEASSGSRLSLRA